MKLYLVEHNTDACARAIADVHLPGQIKTAARLLSTALSKHGVASNNLLPPETVGRPFTAWTKATRQNFLHVAALMLSLICESDYRFGPINSRGCAKYGKERLIGETVVAFHMFVPAGEMQAPPLVMPDRFKQHDTVKAYRNYYSSLLLPTTTWTKRARPSWS